MRTLPPIAGALLLGLASALPIPVLGAPLTLNQVLAYADRPHPDLEAAQAETELARANQLLADSQNDFQITLDAALASGHNPALGGFRANNFATLDARKLLWDGGRNELARSAAALETKGREDQYLSVVAKHRLALMTLFFDVLLTDMQYAVDNELTAVRYVNYDHGRDRRKVGDISDVDLAELKARYQDVRQKRQDDLRRGRDLRAELANAMNRPGDLPSELAEPELKGNDRPLPPLDQLLATMNTGNPRLRAQRALLAAADKQLQAERADNRPSLVFDAGTASYSRSTATRDNLHVGLELSWPLDSGRQDDARIAQQLARLHLLQAQYRGMQLDLRQALRDTYEEIGYLQEAATPAAQVNSDYSDLKLERARAEYELEINTTLGTSMADIQAARLRRKSVEYRLAMAWEKLNDLLGRPAQTLEPANKTEKTQ